MFALERELCLFSNAGCVVCPENKIHVQSTASSECCLFLHLC
ncbi:hypothetical protein L798_11814 [Zootermopsis nevadensis]|uniref:Uncharacterized protein n=1 Tax=Zootermopsis nevadensis TaxID=136037 RepID=A0A067QV57_ZOONE|nr:hypothetical protein L798_11814 [Zootermopsis nevadensis]